jgi:segregation and condensation protein A
MYELKTATYSGPLEKLLELIEERKLPIEEVSLAAVTDDFLKYLETLKFGEGEGNRRADLRVLADFIVVASRLIFIKSKSLLPDLTLSGEEEADIKDLEVRLKLYRALRPAMKLLAASWKSGEGSLSRPYFMNLAHWVIPHPPQGGAYALETESVRFFYPGRNTDTAGMAASMSKLFEVLHAYTQETEVIQVKIMTLEEKIKEVVHRVREIAETSFAKLSAAQSRPEMIVTFLAILHLAREQLIFLEQANPLSDIIIRKKEPAAAAEPAPHE